MENFYTAIEPFCILSKFLGFFPLSFDSPVRKGVLQTKNTDLISSAICVIILLIISQQACDIAQNSSGNENFFRAKVWSWILMFGTISIVILNFVYQMINLKKIVNFFHHLHSCDLKFYMLNAQVNHKRDKILIAIASISALFLPMFYYVFMISAAYLMNQNLGLIWNLMYDTYLVFKCYFFVQFIVAAYAVRERLKALNNSIT